MAMPADRKAFPEGYQRPRVWKEEDADAEYSGSNKATAAPRSEKVLSKGEADIQLYSLATPNGQKLGIMLEELGVDYDAWIVMFKFNAQFTSGHTEVNPNQKIPAVYDYSVKTEEGKPLRIFETGAILLYLADKYRMFVPPVEQVRKRQECLNWLFWQLGTAPFMGGGFGHFFGTCPFELQYCIDRFTMEVKRELDVLNRHFGGEDRYFMKDGETEKKPRKYILGDEYSIADIAIFTWVMACKDHYKSPFERGPKGAEFLDFDNSFPHVKAWTDRIAERPSVKRGRKVNSATMFERHSKEDFPKEEYGSDEVEKWFLESAGLQEEDARMYTRQLLARDIATMEQVLDKPMAEWGFKVSGFHDPKIQKAWRKTKAEVK